MLVLMMAAPAPAASPCTRLQVDSHDGTRVSGFLPSTQSFLAAKRQHHSSHFKRHTCCNLVRFARLANCLNFLEQLFVFLNEPFHFCSTDGLQHASVKQANLNSLKKRALEVALLQAVATRLVHPARCASCFRGDSFCSGTTLPTAAPVSHSALQPY